MTIQERLEASKKLIAENPDDYQGICVCGRAVSAHEFFLYYKYCEICQDKD